MRTPDQTDDGEIEKTSLETRPKRLHVGPQRTLDRRWRVALAICAIALAIIAPLVSATSTRALIVGLFPTPSPTTLANAPLTIINVSTTTTTDIPAAEWDQLRARPLLLPTLGPGVACPAAQGRIVQSGFGPAIGDGPAYIVGMGIDGVLQATGPVAGSKGSAIWGNQFVMFVVAPSYQGAVLVRGHQLDGSHELLFNGGLDQLNGFDPRTPTLLRQLRLESGPAFGSPWTNFPALIRMQSQGCYAIQLDGDTFSEIVVFRIVFGQ